MTAQERMIRAYDRALISGAYRRYYDNSGFYNFGYWATQAQSQREASEALVDRLLDKIPQKGGRILDVACGPGASTRRLTRCYAPGDITAINVSRAQIEAARERAPGCAFLVMDASRLGFRQEYFDAVICVEAAFHFETRDVFLREALRVLKPGGWLVLSDMLFRAFMKPIGDLGQVPRQNFVSDIDGYRARLEAAGFVDVDVEDATAACLGGFRRHLLRWATMERRRGRMALGESLAASLLAALIAQYFHIVCKTYLIASALKPL